MVYGILFFVFMLGTVNAKEISSRETNKIFIKSNRLKLICLT